MKARVICTGMVTLEVEYVLSCALVAAPICGLPTLEEARQGRLMWPRPLFCELHEFWRHHPELLLTEASIRKGRWWTLVSSMFVHMDTQHLMSNLEGLIVSGISVHRDLGCLGLYGVFFASGVTAGLNSRGRLRQAEAQLASSLGAAPEHIAGLAVPEGARNFWDSVRHGTARLAAPVVTEATQSLGASAGVCGLMGYGLAASVEQLWLQARDGMARTVSTRRTISNGILYGDTGQLLALLCSPWLSLAQSGFFLINEWRLWAGKEGRTGTDHSGHLTGFGAGLAAFAAVRAARLISTRVCARRPPPPDSGWRPERPVSRANSGRRYISGGRIIDA